jgi:hypothetical protein
MLAAPELHRSEEVPVVIATAGSLLLTMIFISWSISQAPSSSE